MATRCLACAYRARHAHSAGAGPGAACRGCWAFCASQLRWRAGPGAAWGGRGALWAAGGAAGAGGPRRGGARPAAGAGWPAGRAGGGARWIAPPRSESALKASSVTTAGTTLAVNASDPRRDGHFAGAANQPVKLERVLNSQARRRIAGL